MTRSPTRQDCLQCVPGVVVVHAAVACSRPRRGGEFSSSPAFSPSDARRPNALPSYARQTGQPCGTCHTDFAGLTPYGRRFKIGGYTAGGGGYRSTLFPADVPPTDKKDWVPPISTMAIVDFTIYASAGAGAKLRTPPTTIRASPVSFFYGGAITDHIGAFAQVTYNAPPPGGFGTDPFGFWPWDNTDIRFADSARYRQR